MNPLPYVAILLKLTFTYPTVSAAGCVPDSLDYLDDLTAVEVHYFPRYGVRDSVLYRASAVGKAGMSETITVNPPRPGSLWVETVDDVGNHSCQSNYVDYGLTTGVPSTPPRVDEHTYWVDVAGRRYDREPSEPGVYVQVTGKQKWKIIKLR